MKGKKIIGLLTLVIPFLAMGYMVVNSERQYASGTEYRFDVTGYDPTNFFTGHYLRFSYVLPDNVTLDSCKNTRSCYACLNGGADAPAMSFVPETMLASCKHAFPARASIPSKMFSPEGRLNEYHVAETDAQSLDTLLRQRSGKFKIGLIVLPNHTARIKTMYVDGKPVEQFSR